MSRCPILGSVGLGNAIVRFEAVRVGPMPEEVRVMGKRATAEVPADEGQGHQDQVDLVLVEGLAERAHRDRTSFKVVATQRTQESSLEVSPCK